MNEENEKNAKSSLNRAKTPVLHKQDSQTSHVGSDINFRAKSRNGTLNEKIIDKENIESGRVSSPNSTKHKL
jgi:hypothetical protein